MLIRCLIVLCLVLLPMVGCAGRPLADGVALPARIGDTPSANTTGLDAYETAVVGLLNHMGDAALVLSSVEDVGSAEHAAGMIDEAKERFVDLRQRMKVSEAASEVSGFELALKYGGRYISSKLAIERQMQRIKEVGPEAYETVNGALRRLEEGMAEAGLPTEL